MPLKLQGSNITLRLPRLSDAQPIYENANNPDVLMYTLLPDPYRLEDAIKFIKLERRHRSKRKAFVFCIVPNEIMQPIGILTLDVDYPNKRGRRVTGSAESSGEGDSPERPSP